MVTGEMERTIFIYDSVDPTWYMLIGEGSVLLLPRFIVEFRVRRRVESVFSMVLDGILP